MTRIRRELIAGNLCVRRYYSDVPLITDAEIQLASPDDEVREVPSEVTPTICSYLEGMPGIASYAVAQYFVFIEKTRTVPWSTVEENLLRLLRAMNASLDNLEAEFNANS